MNRPASSLRGATLLGALALGLAAASVFAQTTAYSPPVGGVTLSFAGAVNGVPKITTATPSMRLTVGSAFVGRSIGTLTSVTTTTLTDSQAGWSPGVLSQAAAPYLIKITSGTAAGTWWQVATNTASTATTVTVTNRGMNPVAAGVAVGDSYEVVPADTLNTFFGSIASSIGGTGVATADLVQVHDGVQWREYHYNTTVNQWREGTAQFNRNNTVIRPDLGFVYIRRNSAPISMVILGRVATSTERLVVSASGVTPIGALFPVARTLGSLNLQSNPGFSTFTGSLAAADKVTVFDGVNWRSFHYNASVSQWREGTAQFNRNTYSLPFGAPVLIERGSGSSGAIIVTLTPPYSL